MADVEVLVAGDRPRNDSEAEAYLLVDNRLTEVGGQDDGLMVRMLEDLNAYDAGLFDALAYDVDELDDLFRLHREETEGVLAPEPAPAVDADGEAGPGPGDGTESAIATCPECGHHFQHFSG